MKFLDFHMTERSSVTDPASIEINIQCDAGIWLVCCTKSNSTENDPTNITDVLKCGSTTGSLNKLKFGKGYLRIFWVCYRIDKIVNYTVLENIWSWRNIRSLRRIYGPGPKKIWSWRKIYGL